MKNKQTHYGYKMHALVGAVMMKILICAGLFPCF